MEFIEHSVAWCRDGYHAHIMQELERRGGESGAP